jgi:uncharacterized protein
MADREHRMLYREIPKTTGCVPECHKCCGPVPWSTSELAAITMPVSAEVLLTTGGTQVYIDPSTGMCPMLGKDGCTVYSRRPFMCRLYGAAKGCLCPFGANATKPLSVEKAHTLTDRYRAGGSPNA